MEEKLDSLIKKQLDNSGWNFYNEREHVENLFYSRFNFFLVFYGMLIAAIVTILDSSETKDNYIALSLLCFGVIILLSMQYMLCNIHQTLQILLKLIDGLPIYHSSPIISFIRSRGRTGIIIAFFIPFLCILSLFFILWCCIDKNCECSIPLFTFSLVLVLLACSYNLYVAGNCTQKRDLSDVINEASEYQTQNQKVKKQDKEDGEALS